MPWVIGESIGVHVLDSFMCTTVTGIASLPLVTYVDLFQVFDSRGYAETREVFLRACMMRAVEAGTGNGTGTSAETGMETIRKPQSKRNH